MQVHSFDIFDTLLTRRTATPSGLFLLMGFRLLKTNEILSGFSVQEFAGLRIRSEYVARERSAADEITLREIYEVFARESKLGENEVDALVKLEEDMEMELSVPIPQNIRRVESLIEQGGKIICICDTYLSRSVIERLLAKAGLDPGRLEIYLSSEIKKTKTSGRLFEHVLREKSIQAKHLMHIGDDESGDFAAPRKLGIQAELFKGAALTDYEIVYLDAQNPYHQLYAGASRAARLQDSPCNPFFHLGCSLGGPILYGFVEWVLEQARLTGLQRLYFLARDGQIMMKIAQIINTSRNLGLDLRYLYTARQTCHFSAIFKLDERDIQLATLYFAHITLEMIAKRLNIDTEELRTACLAGGGKAASVMKKANESLDADEVDSIRCLLREDVRLRSSIIEKAQQKREMMLRYLSQEGLLDSDGVAIVDIGWSGGMQDSLYRILASRRRDIRVSGHYYGVFDYSSHTSNENIKRAYAIIPGQMSDFTFVLGLELLTKAQHGTTYDYAESENGSIVPCTKKCTHDPAVDWMQDGILAFAKAFEEAQCAFPELAGGHTGFALKLLDLLRKPNRQTASVLGGMLHSSDQNDIDMREVAPVLSLGDALCYSLLANTKRKHEISNWPEASIARSDTLPGLIVKHIDAAKIVRVARIISNKINFLHRIGNEK